MWIGSSSLSFEINVNLVNHNMCFYLFSPALKINFLEYAFSYLLAVIWAIGLGNN